MLVVCGATDEDRTHNLPLTRRLLCQLSYGGTCLLLSFPEVSQPQTSGGPTGTRTLNQRLMRPLLCPLSYRTSQLGPPGRGCTYRRPSAESSQSAVCPRLVDMSPRIFPGTSWPCWKDSNLRPHAPEACALSSELQQDETFGGCGRSRTPGLAVRSGTLCPTELHTHGAPGETRTPDLLIRSQTL